MKWLLKMNKWLENKAVHLFAAHVQNNCYICFWTAKAVCEKVKAKRWQQFSLSEGSEKMYSDSQFPAGTETPGWRHSNRGTQQTSSQRQQRSGCRHLQERKESRSILGFFFPSSLPRTFWWFQQLGLSARENELVLNFWAGGVPISLHILKGMLQHSNPWRGNDRLSSVQCL